MMDTSGKSKLSLSSSANLASNFYRDVGTCVTRIYNFPHHTSACRPTVRPTFELSVVMINSAPRFNGDRIDGDIQKSCDLIGRGLQGYLRVGGGQAGTPI